jgi:hypothetical protein
MNGGRTGLAARIQGLNTEAERLIGQARARAQLLYAARIAWDRGLSVNRLAELAGVNRRTILRWRKVHGWPRRSRMQPLEVLAGRLDVTCPNCGTSLTTGRSR